MPATSGHVPPTKPTKPATTASRNARAWTWPQHVGLVSRRASAFMLEMVPIQLVVSVVSGPFIAQAIRDQEPWTRAHGEQIGATTSLMVGAAIDLVWFLLRDVVPGLSWGKRVFGLKVVHARTLDRAGFLSRAVRNLPFVLPMFMVAEGLVALVTGSTARRAGDWIGNTRVIARNPTDDLSWTDREGVFLSITLLLFAGTIVAGRYITEAMFNWSYYGELRW